MTSTSSVVELDAAADAREEAEAAVEEVGEDTAERVTDWLERAERLLSQYEDSATGTGNFEQYVAFQGEIEELVSNVPDDLPAREAFDAYDDVLDQRRLSESDFEAAYDALSPAREYRTLLEEREAARDQHREAVRDVRERLDAVESRIAEYDRLLELGQADLAAPVSDLRDPIETYNAAVRAAFREFRSSASARDVLEFAGTAATYPLVGVPEPPDDLRAFVEREDAGEKSVSELLELAEYSLSKLDHYVDDPQRFKRVVSGNRTYLDRLDAEPFVVAWPPLPADELRYRARELVTVVARFADDDVVVLARAVRDLALRDDYDRLRTAAVAKAELTDEERERLASGEVERELERLRDERDELEAALSEHAD